MGLKKEKNIKNNNNLKLGKGVLEVVLCGMVSPGCAGAAARVY